MSDKESKELLVGVNELALVLIGALKDGVQVGDFAALFMKYQSDAILKQKLDAAISGLSGLKAEFASFGLMDGLDLAQTQISYIPKILEAFKPAVV